MPSWSRLAASSRPKWTPRGPQKAPLGAQKSATNIVAFLVGARWPLGTPLGPSWGPFWALLGPFLGSLGTILRLSFGPWVLISKRYQVHVKLVSHRCVTISHQYHFDLTITTVSPRCHNIITLVSQCHHAGKAGTSLRYHQRIAVIPSRQQNNVTSGSQRYVPHRKTHDIT